MLYHLFEYLDREFDLPGAGLFRFISFRAGVAIMISLIISLLLGNRIIRSLKRLQIGETVRDLGLEGQKQKEGTPTMGGLIILLAILVPCLLLARLDNVYIILMVLTTVWMGVIGFIDDYIKVFKKNKQGLKAKFKLFGQIVLGIIVGLTMLFHQDVVIRLTPEVAAANGYQVMRHVQIHDQTVAGEWKDMVYCKSSLTNVPFFKGNQLDYQSFVGFMGDNAQNWIWLIFIPLTIIIVTAVSNGSNLTDGLDGLATGTSAIIGLVLVILSYVSGNVLLADYLNIFFIPYSGELVVFSACFLGACIGFLWYNSFPAKVFMGDTGSLTIGAIIAVMAIALRKELLLPVLCGIFLIEILSVMIQVYYFKYTKRKYGEGRRIFRMSPLHHHFQKVGMHEAKIVTRFWIVGVMLAVVTLITLKVR
ncbi:MAG TPA: phospho-N-acetylmuramoyl-pentapeptide-transferase [Saprospiraceae bacterium]|nr:phospho-N-acetylmuramoyl-pentapeptide-transferase [Saprospiraceae bacterium]HQW25801.1 phospho-N-acetylmuramoyl-pentapeptide-transferase [Saprospiraceae bacterium]